MQAVEPRITDEVFSVLSVDRSVRSRTSYGGTAPANVRRALDFYRSVGASFYIARAQALLPASA